MTEALREIEGSGSAQQIARVAARLFARQGYEATSVRQITDEAGVTKPTLYYHYGSKEGLAQALLTVPIRLLTERISRIVAEPGSAVDRLGEFLEIHFEFCREEPDRLRFLYALVFGPMGGGLAEEVCEHSCVMDALESRLVDRAVGEGWIAAADAGRFLVALKGGLVIHTLGHLYRGLNLEPGLGHQIVRDLLAGFGIEPSPARSDAGASIR